MNAIEIIKKKRNKQILDKDEIIWMIDSFTKVKIPDYQMSAFLMAIYLNGMTVEETAFLTEAMLHSGVVVELSSVKGLKIDKHSTGGVGDKTSMILAPIVAAAGVPVPMISGRGLGHTGGTLDKLEAIPGFSTNMTLKDYKKQLQKINAVMIGQTKEIAPADKSIYALRDVTGTVESIPLITSSIMSKKLAEGIDGLVLDIKTGSGAFMVKHEDARKLAKSLIGTAKEFDKKVLGFITDMNQPLGNYIGNWLEIVECVKILSGEWVDDLCTVSLTLSGAMLFLAGKAKSIDDGIKLSMTMIKSGLALKKFLEIVKAQGGDITYLQNFALYPKSKVHAEFCAPQTGYISSIDTYQVGMAGLELGAGRLKKEDVIDPKAGLILHAKIGDMVSKGQLIAEIFTDDRKKVAVAQNRLAKAFNYSQKKPAKLKLIKEIIK
jgi:pyrimidine-nucleoside phosphorylase